MNQNIADIISGNYKKKWNSKSALHVSYKMSSYSIDDQGEQEKLITTLSNNHMSYDEFARKGVGVENGYGDNSKKSWKNWLLSYTDVQYDGNEFYKTTQSNIPASYASNDSTSDYDYDGIIDWINTAYNITYAGWVENQTGILCGYGSNSYEAFKHWIIAYFFESNDYNYPNQKYVYTSKDGMLEEADPFEIDFDMITQIKNAIIK